MLGQHLAPWKGELVSRHLQLGGGSREHNCGIWSLFAVLPGCFGPRVSKYQRAAPGGNTEGPWETCCVPLKVALCV